MEAYTVIIGWLNVTVIFIEFFTAVIYTYIYIHFSVSLMSFCTYLFKLVKGTIL